MKKTDKLLIYAINHFTRQIIHSSHVGYAEAIRDFVPYFHEQQQYQQKW